jgi:LmbE family N-acetylglucosaminyl deacetylase
MSIDDDALTVLTHASRHLFLSPHYDDIPLSAGATVRHFADRGLTPETLVVFGSEPDRGQQLSPFAQQMHQVWGLTADQVIASRYAEETAAASILGATTRVLPFRDAIYRGHVYLSDPDLFGVPALSEAALPPEIVESLELGQSPDTGTRIYAPLAVGKHVDHQLVHWAAKDLATSGWDVWFYEDIPYALKPDALETRLAEIREPAGIRLEPVTSIPAESVWDRKIDAILRYPSQLETVFRQYVGVGTTRREISEALKNYAVGAGDGVLAERFWRISEEFPPQGS